MPSTKIFLGLSENQDGCADLRLLVADPSTKVAHCSRVHNMLPLWPLVDLDITSTIFLAWPTGVPRPCIQGLIRGHNEHGLNKAWWQHTYPLASVGGGKLWGRSSVVGRVWFHHTLPWGSILIISLHIALWAQYRLQFLLGHFQTSNASCSWLEWATPLILGNRIKGQGQLWNFVYKTLWAQYRLQFLPNPFQTSYLSCAWWEEEPYWFWVGGS